MPDGRRPHVVVLGGGTGTSGLLRGLRQHQVRLTAIVTMFDDGGSSGILRRELGVAALGDLRQCLTALADHAELAELAEHRFATGASLAGHSLGNLILAALVERYGLDGGLRRMAGHLRAAGTVIPVTETSSELILVTGSGPATHGEVAIWGQPLPAEDFELRLVPPAALSPPAGRALADADLIVVAPGSFYTSLVPLLLVDGMASALSEARAPVCVVTNLVNKPGHTDGFTSDDYVRRLHAAARRPFVDHVLVNTAAIPTEQLRRLGGGGDQVRDGTPPDATYRRLGQDLVQPEPAVAAVNSLLPRTQLRHDPGATAVALLTLIPAIP